MTFAELILVNALAAWFEVEPGAARLLWTLYRHGGPLTQPAWADLAGTRPSCISVYLTYLRKPLGHDAFVTGRPGPNSRRLLRLSDAGRAKLDRLFAGTLPEIALVLVPRIGELAA